MEHVRRGRGQRVKGRGGVGGDGVERRGRRGGYRMQRGGLFRLGVLCTRDIRAARLETVNILFQQFGTNLSTYRLFKNEKYYIPLCI